MRFTVVPFFLTGLFLSFLGAGSTAGGAENVTYANGDITLAGTIYLPEGAGPHPGVVLIQGSGTSGRSNVWSQMMADMLTDMGVAVLLNDKRGSGESGGDWRTSSFEDLADDTLAGVAVLRTHPEIQPDNVGVIGLSQGGRIAPLAAARGKVDFVINFAGGAVSAKDGLFHELEQTYRQHGFNEEDIAFLQEMTRLSFAYIETGEGFDEYLAYREKVREKFGEPFVESWPDARDHWYWMFWGYVHDYNPIPYWKIVIEEKQIPVFIAYGEEDERDNVPVAASVKRLQENISSSLLEVHVYPGVGHSMIDHSTPAMTFAEDLRNDLQTWVQTHVEK